jgi:hypothetical protein
MRAHNTQGPLFSVGIEGTLEPRSGRDTLVRSGHFRNQRWPEDFKLVRGLDLTEVRYRFVSHSRHRPEESALRRGQSPLDTGRRGSRTA